MASEERRTKSTEELADEIINGVWGCGAERRDNITKQYGAAAYKAAQTIVNERIIKEEHKRRNWFKCKLWQLIKRARRQYGIHKKDNQNRRDNRGRVFLYSGQT